MKIVLFSPIRERAAILRETLAAHRDLAGVSDRWYYDDNDEPESRALLAGENLLPPLIDLAAMPYDRGGETHAWPAKLITRLSKIRNVAIDRFLHSDATHLFMIDADVLPNPYLVEHLASLDAPIVSEVFWTQWRPDTPWMPNVWDAHFYSYFGVDRVTRLRKPGQYAVGGLGACTLIARDVLESGQIAFKPVPGVELVGEDRWFCTRAAAHDIPLMADTMMTPFHVYRPEQLDEARVWRWGGCHPWYFRDYYLTNSWAEMLERAA